MKHTVTKSRHWQRTNLSRGNPPRIVHSNTRLRHSNDHPNDVKFPIILPKRNHVTRLIVKYHHESEGHQMAVNYTMNHLREKYLVIHVREEVKRVNRDCRECARHFKVQPVQQQMAPLPKIRLQNRSLTMELILEDRTLPFKGVDDLVPLFVFVLANTLLPLRDGDFIGYWGVPQRFGANGGKERMADENGE